MALCPISFLLVLYCFGRKYWEIRTMIHNYLYLSINPIDYGLFPKFRKGHFLKHIYICENSKKDERNMLESLLGLEEVRRVESP